MDQDAPIPSRIDDYEVGARLGVGGFGQVFAARHVRLERDVALKVLHAHRCHDRDAVSRFLAEARAANQIKHPSIVKIEGFGVLEDGRHYIAMELVEGESLRSILDTRGALPLEEAMPILRKLADAVDAAHRAGIAHRDLKPENVIVCADGSIRLIDFGLAKLTADSTITQTGVVLGSPRYMSPEQCRGRGGTERSDLYSFGAVAYHVLTGAPPFAGDALALALQHVNERPVPASQRATAITPATAEVIAQLLDKDPALRPAPLATTVEELYAGSPRLRYRRALPYAVAGAAIAVVAAVGGLLWSMRETTGTPFSLPVLPAITAVRAPTVHGTLERLAIKSEPATPPWMNADGTRFVYATVGGTYEFANGHVLEIDHEPTYRSQFPDGRWLVSRSIMETKQKVFIEDPRDHSSVLLSDGTWGEVCPTGKRIGLFRQNHLLYLDVAGTTVTRTEDAGTMGSDIVARWNSSCDTSIVWGGAGPGVGGFVIRGARETLPQFGAAPFPITPGAYVRDDTLLYCDPSGVARLHQFGTQPDVSLGMTIPMSSCNVAAAGGGGHAVLNATTAYRRVVRIDPMVGRSQPITPATSLQFAVGFLDDKTLISAAYGAGISEWDVPMNLPTTNAPPRTLYRTDLTSGTQTTIASCPGESAEVVRAGKLVHVTREVTGETSKFVFHADGTCAVLETFPLPKALTWGNPACRANVCAAVAADGDQIVVYRLERTGAVKLGSVKRLSPYPNPIIALSPDGSRVVATMNGEISVYVFSTTQPDAKPIAITVRTRDPANTFIQSLAWANDPNHFYMAGARIDDQKLGAMFEVGLDGSRRVIPHTSELPVLQVFGATSPGGILTATELTSDSAWYRVDLKP